MSAVNLKMKLLVDMLSANMLSIFVMFDMSLSHDILLCISVNAIIVALFNCHYLCCLPSLVLHGYTCSTVLNALYLLLQSNMLFVA